MTDLVDFARVRELSDDYYRHRISEEEYRLKRSELLNSIDDMLNGDIPAARDDETGLRFVSKLKALFKTQDEEKTV